MFTSYEIDAFVHSGMSLSLAYESRNKSFDKNAVLIEIVVMGVPKIMVSCKYAVISSGNLYALIVGIRNTCRRLLMSRSLSLLSTRQLESARNEETGHSSIPVRAWNTGLSTGRSGERMCEMRMWRPNSLLPFSADHFVAGCILQAAIEVLVVLVSF